VLLAAGASVPVRAAAQGDPVTVCVLPLDVGGADPALSDLAGALSELLALAFARSDECALVDRARLAALLAEQSLASALAEDGARRTLGRLLGARWLVHGTLARRGTRLWIAVHVTDVESTRVLASQQVEADPGALEQALPELVAGLMRALRAPRGGPAQELDPTPLASLHFLRGLSHATSGQHERALAEFLRSGAEPALAAASALWRANCYLALERHAHAYLELARLTAAPGEGGVPAAPAVDPRVLDQKLALCRAALPADELRTCERLLAATSSGRPPPSSAQR
jgi:TolB-like protein